MAKQNKVIPFRRAPKKDADMVRMYLGDWYPPTYAGLRLALREQVPHVRDALVRSAGPGRVDVLLRGAWWLPLTFGLMRWVTIRRALRVACRLTPAGILVGVRFGLRRGE